MSQTVAQEVVRELGNYGEICERHFGSGGVGVPRPSVSRNALWADAPCQNCPKGGQIYAPPFQQANGRPEAATVVRCNAWRSKNGAGARQV